MSSIFKPSQLLSPKEQKPSVSPLAEVVMDSSLPTASAITIQPHLLFKKKFCQRGQRAIFIIGPFKVLFQTEVSQQSRAYSSLCNFMILSHRKIHLQKYSFYREKKGAVYIT